jgi:hypothetical protein
LSIWYSSNARSPSPRSAYARADHSAACVYCAPFSRPFVDELALERLHRRRLAHGRACAGDHAPALRDGIDATTACA